MVSYNGEQNTDMDTNGEAALLTALLVHNQTPCVFDVGANVGEYSKRILLANPNARIYAFEPDPESYNTLHSALGSKITIENIALSSKQGTRILYRASASEMNSLYETHSGQHPHTGQVAVQTETLDAYCERAGVPHIDLLKIDTEGHDLEVLKAGKKMLSGGIDYIQFEFGAPSIYARVYFKDFFDLLITAGYSLFKIYPEGLLLIEEYEVAQERCLYANFFAVASGCSISGIPIVNKNHEPVNHRLP